MNVNLKRPVGLGEGVDARTDRIEIGTVNTKTHIGADCAEERLLGFRVLELDFRDLR